MNKFSTRHKIILSLFTAGMLNFLTAVYALNFTASYVAAAGCIGTEVAEEISRKGQTFEEYMTGVIPYPKGLVTPSEGAAAAPQEINHPNSLYFSENDYFTMTNTKTRIILSHYPTYQQTTEYTCGPAAALTVLYYYGNKDFDEISLAKGMKTQGYPIGTNPLDMTNFFREIGWKVSSSLDSQPNSHGFETYSAFKDFARSNLRQGTPILVENVEWGGHWRVIIGYDTMGTESTLDDVLIMADPYDTCDHKQDGYVVQNGEKFYSMWFDQSMLPKEQCHQPWIIAQPK